MTKSGENQAAIVCSCVLLDIDWVQLWGATSCLACSGIVLWGLQVACWLVVYDGCQRPPEVCVVGLGVALKQGKGFCLCAAALCYSMLFDLGFIMLRILPIAALSDNYIWLLHDGRDALCIDPSEAAPVLAILTEMNLNLKQIWLTHHHADHTAGVADLLAAYPDCQTHGAADVSPWRTVGEGDVLAFAGCRAQVWHTAGHTATHLSYVLYDSAQVHVFCGDTLFSAGCGRVFTGTVAALFASLGRFAALPDDALFYPAHEYTRSNLRFAAAVEPDNVAVQAALRDLTVPSLPTVLEREKCINPFLRCGVPAVRAAAQVWAGRNLADDAAVFAALREWKNGF